VRETSSIVVSRCKLSSTTLNVNAGVYCFRLAAISIRTFLAYLSVSFTRYGTIANSTQ
jgi:hypothetical protein